MNMYVLMGIIFAILGLGMVACVHKKNPSFIFLGVIMIVVGAMFAIPAIDHPIMEPPNSPFNGVTLLPIHKIVDINCPSDETLRIAAKKIMEDWTKETKKVGDNP